MTTAPSTRPTDAPAGAEALRALYADWSEIIATTPGLTTRLFRSIFDEWHQPTREPEDVTYREETVGGVPGIWTLPIGADTSRVLLYTHGGGFAVGSAASHRKLAAHVAKALGVTAFVLDYRRAPEHPHPAQVEDGVAAFVALTERGIAPADITTIGDSAGGNLAVADRARAARPGPAAARPGHRLLAVAGHGERGRDPGDQRRHRRAHHGPPARGHDRRRSRRGGGRPADAAGQPALRRLHADFPPLYVNAGAVESLVDNATRLAEKASAAGVEVTVSVADGMQHVFPCLAGNASEADDEIAAIAAWYRG